VISELTVAEMHRVLRAKVFARAVPAHFAELAYREFRSSVNSAVFDVVPFSRAVQQEFDRILPICYRARPAVPIRTLDGLLLASALVAKMRELVTTDARMRAAAALFGLRALPD
jgi:hypothetical protein